MGSANLTMGVNGIDKTGAAFRSVKNRAAVTSAQIRSMVGGALGGIGAYFSFRAIKGGIDELGHLSDVAQKTGTSVDDLTRTTSALSALGVNMGVDQLGKAFDYMAKATGRSGMEGFFKTVDELGKIDDVAQRAQAAMQIFGRSGMEFMPLINAADDSIDALRTVVNAMPAIPQSAANAGDAMSDAMGFAANQVKSIWLQGLGTISGWFDNEYKGGVREASLQAGNFLEYYTKIAVSKCLTLYRKLQNGLKAWGEGIGAFLGGAYEKMFGSGGTWGNVWKQTTQAFTGALDEYEEESKKLDAIEAQRTARFEREYENRKIAIEKFQGAYDKAAVSIEGRKGRGASDEEELKRRQRISNDLIMGGSNAATRLQLMGPQFQNEAKKQTAILEKIARNTEKTADNTEAEDEERFDTVTP